MADPAESMSPKINLSAPVSMELTRVFASIERLTEDKVRAEERLLAIARLVVREEVQVNGAIREVAALLERHYGTTLESIAKEEI